ncbi:hypothetical protein [Phocaeicola sp.]
MTLTEVRYFLEGYERRKRDAWEQTRILGYITAQVNSTKSLKQTDILSFPWDEKEHKRKAVSVPESEIKRLRNKAKQVEQTLNK